MSLKMQQVVIEDTHRWVITNGQKRDLVLLVRWFQLCFICNYFDVLVLSTHVVGYCWYTFFLLAAFAALMPLLRPDLTRL